MKCYQFMTINICGNAVGIVRLIAQGCQAKAQTTLG